MMGNNSGNNRGCNRQEELVTYLYGESSPDAAKQFETHIRECLTCAREMREFSALRDNMQAWELDTLPHIVIEPKRSFGMVLRELFALTPVWAKAATAVAALLIFAAILNVEINIGNVRVSANIFRKNQPVITGQPASINRDDVAKLIEQKVAESERRNREEMLTKLTKLSDELRESQTTEFASFSKNLRRDQQEQFRRIMASSIARNDLNFSALFNGLDSEKDKEDNKEK